MEVLFPKINHLFGTFFYDSSLLCQQNFRRNNARNGIEDNICYDCMMDFRVMSVKL